MSRKVTVIGAGNVGATIAYTLSLGDIASQIVVVDINKEKVEGEVMDIVQGTSFREPISVIAGDYADAADSDIVIITSGIGRKAGQSRIDLAQTNVNIMKDIARFNAMKDKRNIVSLNYAQREKENEEDDAIRLARVNDRLKREGKPLLKKIDDLPKDYQEPDPYLDETVHIAIDLAQQEKAQPPVEPPVSK